MVVQGLSRVHVTRRTGCPYSQMPTSCSHPTWRLMTRRRTRRPPLAARRGHGARAPTRSCGRGWRSKRRRPATRTGAPSSSPTRRSSREDAEDRTPVERVAHRNGYVEVAAREAVAGDETRPAAAAPPVVHERADGRRGRTRSPASSLDLTVLLPDGAADAAAQRERVALRGESAALDAVVDTPSRARRGWGGGRRAAGASRRSSRAPTSTPPRRRTTTRRSRSSRCRWLELDALVNPDAPRGEGASARLMTDADVPPELLGLLPPAPPGGWPRGLRPARPARGDGGARAPRGPRRRWRHPPRFPDRLRRRRGLPAAAAART